MVLKSFESINPKENVLIFRKYLICKGNQILENRNLEF